MNIDALASLGWVRITADDEELYQYYYDKSADQLSYENNWAFVCQESRFFGIRYHHSGLLLTAVLKYDASPFLFVFPPLCADNISVNEISKITRRLKVSAETRVILRKLPDWLFSLVMNSGMFVQVMPDVFHHPRDCPEDIKPQVIINVGPSLACAAARFARIRNHIRHFRQVYTPKVKDLSYDLVEDVVTLVERWNLERNEQWRRKLDTDIVSMSVDTAAYVVFARTFAGRIDKQRYFAKVVYVNGIASGFIFVGRTARHSAALYSSISLTSFRGSAEYLLQEVLAELVTADITLLNLGGAETDGLFRFKAKFDVSALRQSYDAELL
jgi:hypothetical protein